MSTVRHFELNGYIAVSDAWSMEQTKANNRLLFLPKKGNFETKENGEEKAIQLFA